MTTPSTTEATTARDFYPELRAGEARTYTDAATGVRVRAFYVGGFTSVDVRDADYDLTDVAGLRTRTFMSSTAALAHARAIVAALLGGATPRPVTAW